MAQQVAKNSIILKAKCHCGAYNTAWSIPRSEVPLKSAICSCNSCRKVSGQMFTSFAVMPETAVNITDPAAPQQVSNADWKRRNIGGNKITPYNFSTNLVSTFCSICGATIANFEPGEWEFATGVLSVDWNGERPAVEGSPAPVNGSDIQGLLNRQALFAGDPADGGGAVWFPKLNSAGEEIKTHHGSRTSPLVDLHAKAEEFAAKKREKEAEDVIEASCHCQTVRFFITRPDPENPAGAEKKPGNSRLGRWWIGDEKESKPKKYLGLVDACDSCRSTTGFEILTWTFVPPQNLFVLGEDNDWAKRRTYNPDDPSLKLTHYYSSKHVRRSFCSTCGAPTACLTDTRDPSICDFGVGLLSGDGARFEDWVEWKYLEYPEDAIDPLWVNELKKRVDAH